MKTNLLLKDYLRRLKLPTILGIYEKLAQEAQEKNLSYEDSLMSGEEGIKKAIAFLRNVMIEKPRSAMW